MSRDTKRTQPDDAGVQGGPAAQAASQTSPARRPSLFRRIGRRVDAIPLSTKLVTCIIVLLTIGTIGISFSIRTLVGNYLLQKTDTQLINQAQLVFNNMDSLGDTTDSENSRNSLMNTYYVEVRTSDSKITGTGLVPVLKTEWFPNRACRRTAAATA